jgi:MFS family permease
VTESYRALVGRPYARRLLTALCIAWLSFGMVGLALLLAAGRATGSFAVAGLVVAAFSVGSGAMSPVRGRLIDRRGASPWLPLLAAGYATSLGLFAALASFAPRTGLLMLCAAAAGVSAPPIVATTRGLWSEAVGPELLRRAYALTSLISDLGQVAAPALGGLLFVLAPWGPLVVCGVSAFVAAGIVARAAPPAVRSSEPATPAASPLRSAAMRTLLGVSVALGAALGLVYVAVPAAATRWGVPSLSGFLLGAFALGSVVGGLWFARRDWRGTPAQRYLVAVLGLAVALAPPLLATGALTIAPLLFVAGLGYGPATISLFEALDSVASRRATEALTWVTTAEAAGASAGAAVSGWASVRLGTWSPYAIASVVLAVAATAGLARQRGAAGRAGQARTS